MCRLHGMELIFTDRESYRDKQALFTKYFAGDENAFFIDEGGASPEAAQGCSELINELTEPYDHLFCASGTGTMAAGIINGITSHKLPTVLHSIPVFKNGAVTYRLSFWRIRQGKYRTGKLYKKLCGRYGHPDRPYIYR